MKSRMKKWLGVLVLAAFMAFGVLPIKSSAAFDTGVRDGVCVVASVSY